MEPETSQPGNTIDPAEPIGLEQTPHSGRLVSAIQLAIRLAGLAVALLLIVVGLSKAFEPGPFAEAIRAHGLVPGSWAQSMATGVIGLEIGVGVVSLILIACTTRAKLGLFVLGAMSTALTAYAAGLWMMPPDQPAPCGCGLVADAGPANWAGIVLRNAIGTGLVLAGGIVLPGRTTQQTQRVNRPSFAAVLG